MVLKVKQDVVMIQPITEIPEGNRIKLSLNGGILTKGQPTEVLAGSGESAEDAENPESGKPPVLSLKIQGEGRVSQAGELEPRKAGGVLGKKYNLGRGTHHPRFHSHCFIPPRLKRGERWKKHPSFSLPVSDPLLVPSFCWPNQKPVGRSQLLGARTAKRKGSGSREGLGAERQKALGNSITSLSLGCDSGWQDEVWASDLISQKSTRKYHFGKIICFKKIQNPLALLHSSPLFKFYLNLSFRLPPSNTEVFGSNSPLVGRLCFYPESLLNCRKSLYNCQDLGNFPKIPIKVGDNFSQKSIQPPTDDSIHHFFDKCQMHWK